MSSEAYYAVAEPGRLTEGSYRGVWQPSVHAGGAWQPGEQHMGPVSGLAVHAVEEFVRLREQERGPDGLQVARISYDILGMIADGPTAVTVDVRRPGRTIELLEAVVTTGGRPSVTARVWRLTRTDSASVAGGAPAPMPDPQNWPVTSAFDVWQGGFIASLEARVEPGAAPGRTRTWLRPLVDLVADGPGSELARFLGLVDGANGIAVRLPPQHWLFPNVDLTVHLHRLPHGPWVGFDTQVIFGPDGVGLTDTTLSDTTGPVGRAEQILTLRPLDENRRSAGSTG